MYQLDHSMLWCWNVARAVETGDLTDQVCDVRIIYHLHGDHCRVQVLLGLDNLSTLRISE